jgi:hypothetical protein
MDILLLVLVFGLACKVCSLLFSSNYPEKEDVFF